MSTPRALRVLGLLAVPLLAFALPTSAAGTDGGSPVDGGATGEDGCAEALVTHTPTGSHGDTSAVAITSQVLDAEVDGWQQVGWEANDGVEVVAVLVTGADGTDVLDGGRSGTTGPAHEVTFCGESIATTPVGAATSGQPTATVSLLGATVGVAIATIVLLLSRGGRRTSARHRIAPGRAA